MKQAPPWLSCIAAAACFLAVPAARAQQAEEDKKATAELTAEYEERLKKADPSADPKQHKNLASWCKRNYPEKYSFHQNAYNEFVFKGLEEKLPASPTAAQLKQLQEEAVKLELPGKSREYLAKWGEIQFKTFEAKLKPGDVKMMQMLLKWSLDNGVSFIDPVKGLAGKILELDKNDLSARKVLGQLQIEGVWKSPDEAFAGIDLRNPKQRVELHRKLTAAAAGSAEKPAFPSNPVKGMEQVDNYYLTATANSGGEAKYFVAASGYSKSKPCPLVISLHGGGSGGFEKARGYAAIAVSEWTKGDMKGGCVAIAPIARKHVTNSWGTLSNFEDLIDAIEETMQRFNIDRKRIYVTGQSMGGGGTSLYYLCFPEMAGAFCARAGFYFRDGSVKDVLGKPLMVIQGEKDEAFRVKSRDELLKQVESIGGKVTHVSLPDVDHFIMPNDVMPRLVPFFEDNQNDIEPDFRLIRAAGRKYFKN